MLFLKKINKVKSFTSNTNNALKTNDINIRNSQSIEPGNPDNSVPPNDYSEMSNLTKEMPYNDIDNIDYLKEVILNSDTSLYEKYEKVCS